jgi:hypothetical protein
MRRLSFVIALLSALVLLVVLLGIGQSQEQTVKHLDLLSQTGSGPIPGNCSYWQELYPDPNAYYHQDDYSDNGDREVSPCDYITLDDVRYHIVDVVPTFFFSTTAGQKIYEGTMPYADELGDPTNHTWIQIQPSDRYGDQVLVEDWSDGNDDGLLSVCDDVYIEGQWWHVEKIGLDLIIGEEESAIETGTWGSIKSFFHQLIH